MIECVAIEMQDKSGSGTLLLDSKKTYAINHWFTLTCPEAKHEVSISLKDAPFQFGPWGEQLSIMRMLYIGSTTDLGSIAGSGMEPVAQEANISLDWTLPMSAESQGFLFRRIRLAFEKSTAIIVHAPDKRKYRMAEDALTTLRNLMCLWSQIRSFCSTRLDKFAELDEALKSGSSRDHELMCLLDNRPPSFAISMLPSAQREACEKARSVEEGACLQVEQERLKVRDARWQYFQAALGRDQETLKQIAEAPQKMATLKHRKAMQWRIGQAKSGEKAVKAYMEKFMRCMLVQKAEHAQQQFNEYRTFVATRHS